MSKLRKIVLNNVRCFEENQSFDIRPLTIIVGENSTGKSTALWSIHSILNSFNEHLLLGEGKFKALDLNLPPYFFGSFNEVVRENNNNTFEIGIELKDHDLKNITTIYSENSQGTEPILNKIIYKLSDGEITIELQTDDKFDIDSSRCNISENKYYVIMPVQRQVSLYYFLFNAYYYTNTKSESNNTNDFYKAFIKYIKNKFKDSNEIKFEDKDYVVNFMEDSFHNTVPLSIAPVRSSPKRTYDPVIENTDSEGSEVPMFLNRLKTSNSEEWIKLKKDLDKFGKLSGLYEEIDIKKHGELKSDPFQIQVKVRGKTSNIIDVGYGVSQILPIIIRIFRAVNNCTFLLQEPEIHLHPQAQAALTSLIVESTMIYKNRMYVLETHGDAITRRARIEVLKKRISHEDVSIIYLEPKNSHVIVHNMKLDEMGNLLEVPDSYRKFFLDEINDALGTNQ